MKYLLMIVILLFLLAARQAPAVAQSSLKFIDGIELKPDMAEYGTITPIPEPVKIIPVKKANTIAVSKGSISTEACKSLQFKYAQIMDIDIEDISNISLYDFIEDWWDTRYRYGGTTKKGIDCSAFTGLLMSTVFTTSLPRTAREQYALTERISKSDLKQGDLLFFNTRGGVSHVGVYLANNFFVHASINGVTISSLDDAYYSRKYIGAGRVSTPFEN